MLLQILGIVDILAASLLTLNYLGFAFPLLLYLSFFIIIKSLLFFDGIVGIMDLIGGLLIVLVSLFSIQLYPLITGILVLWYLQKGFLSLVN